MNIIYVLLPAALLLVLLFVGLYLWAVKRDQFDDLDSPAKRMLLDDLPPRANPDQDTPTKTN